MRFLKMLLVFTKKLRLLSKNVPGYLKLSTIPTGCFILSVTPLSSIVSSPHLAVLPPSPSSVLPPPPALLGCCDVFVYSTTPPPVPPHCAAFSPSISSSSSATTLKPVFQSAFLSPTKHLLSLLGPPFGERDQPPS